MTISRDATILANGICGAHANWCSISQSAAAGKQGAQETALREMYATMLVFGSAGRYSVLAPEGVSGATAATAPTDGAGGNPTSVFWSGSRVAKSAAEEWAAANGGQTLEMTSAGRALEQATAQMKWEDAAPLWDAASKNFADNASGVVQVFQASSVRIESVWARIEYPTLLQNENVTGITYNLAEGP